MRPVLRALQLKGCIERDLNGKSTIGFVSSQPSDVEVLTKMEIDDVLRTIYLRTEFIGILTEFKTSIINWQRSETVLTKFMIDQYTRHIKSLINQNIKSRNKLKPMLRKQNESQKIRLIG